MLKRQHVWQVHCENWRDTGQTDTLVFKLVDQGGRCATQFSIPIDELSELIAPFLAVHCHLSLEGTLNLQPELTGQSPDPNKTAPLVQLVNALLEPASLQDEPDIRGRLSCLRELFAKSLSLIEDAIADNPAGKA